MSKAENFSVLFVFERAAHLFRGEKNESSDFHEGNAPGNLLLSQPAQRGTGFLGKEQFQQPGSADKLLISGIGG